MTEQDRTITDCLQMEISAPFLHFQALLSAHAWRPLQALLVSFCSGLGHNFVDESLKSERRCQVPRNPQKPAHVGLEWFELPTQHQLQVLSGHHQCSVHFLLSQPDPFPHTAAAWTQSETVLSGSGW